MADLVPPWAIAEDTRAGALNVPAVALYPEEAARVARAVPKRQEEFTTVRVCARKALSRIGYAPVPLLGNRRGAPRWPTGVVGSMTHCDGYRAAVVARRSDAASIGIDAEPHAPLPQGVFKEIALPPEQDHLQAMAEIHPTTHWDRLLFSAKESVFKAWYPLTSRELDFDEAEVTFDASAERFSARLLVPGPVSGGCRLQRFEGRWAAGAGLVVTAIVLPAPAPGG